MPFMSALIIKKDYQKGCGVKFFTYASVESMNNFTQLVVQPINLILFVVTAAFLQTHSTAFFRCKVNQVGICLFRY